MNIQNIPTRFINPNSNTTKNRQYNPNFTGFNHYKFDDLFDEFLFTYKIDDKKLAQLFPQKVDIIKKFLSLENYDIEILGTSKNKKRAELKYLYDLASKQDIADTLRIPAENFSEFSKLTSERLKEIEPILLSKRDIGLWNFTPEEILQINKLDENSLNTIIELTKCKVTPFSIKAVVTSPDLNWAKTVEKAKSLKELYGDDLREVEFYSNRKGENFFLADIQLPHKENKPDWLNFQRITVKLDDDVTPITKKKMETDISEQVENIYKKTYSKLEIFTEEDLKKAISEIKKEIPEAEENEILTTIQKLTQFSSYKSLPEIGKQLLDIGITEFANLGELYPYFDYFQKSKKLIPLKTTYPKKLGIIFTKNDIQNKTLMERLKNAKNNPAMENVEFINLEGFLDGINLFSDNKNLPKATVPIIKEAKKLQAQHPNLTFKECLENILNNEIETKLKKLGLKVYTVRFDNPQTKHAILEQMLPIMPTKDKIQAVIETIADNYTLEKKGYTNLSKAIAKYYAANVNVYSKQSIIEDMKKLQSQIDNYLYENNLPKENLYLVEYKMEKPKSFNIINKMYRELFNIPEEKFLQISEVTDLNKYPPNSSFLILDDIAGTGESMLEIGNYIGNTQLIAQDKHILFSPISATQEGLSNILNFINSSARKNKDTVIYLGKNITHDTYHKDIFSGKLMQIKSAKIADMSEKGYQGQALCTVFPYMSPDNNSLVSSNFVNLFLPNSRGIKTKPSDFYKLEENATYYNIFGQKKSALKELSNNEKTRGFIQKLIDFFFDK